MEFASVIKPSVTTYRGDITDPDRWGQFRPRRGDVIIATPSKSGTTWTQSIAAMLLNGGPNLPDRLTEISPWFDAGFVALDEVVDAVARQAGRRVIKTHTPVDGFPVWEDVKVIAVFRHPMEMFVSLKKHIANMKDRAQGPMSGSTEDALTYFLDTPFDRDNADEDSIMTVTRHFEASVLSGHLPPSLVLNYAAMLRDHAGAVARLDNYLGTGRDESTLAAITEATAFGAMKANATQFAPEGGRGFWHEDQAFFASGTSGGWQDQFSPHQIAAYEARFAKLLPDAAHRQWIETGLGWDPPAPGA
jgi:aryl sulfotransferase